MRSHGLTSGSAVFIPITDRNERVWIRYHFVTLLLISTCTVIFFLQVSGGEVLYERLIYGLGSIPSVLWGKARLPDELYLVPAWATLVISTFLHGDILHLAGNMLFLWVFGDNVEDSMGHGRFILFYLLCGTVAALAHAVAQSASQVPVIGASGAVSGVLGAYFVLHPRIKVWIVMFAFIPVRLPTWAVLGAWFAMQVMFAFFIKTGDSEQVAWWAHLAGFAAGAALIVPFRLPHVALWDPSDDGRIDVGGLRFRRQAHNRGKGAEP